MSVEQTLTIARVRDYHARIDRLRTSSGSTLESVLRSAFQRLLQDWAEAQDLIFAPELPLGTGAAASRVPDGTILHEIRIKHGYWEAKDTDDDLDEEIAKKRAVGYPITNTIFEDTETAVLFQDGREAMRCRMANAEDLARLLAAFFDWQPAVIGEWRKAVEQFRAELPTILDHLRRRIDSAYKDNAEFGAKAGAFLEHVRETVNPNVAEPDVREMLIQHILTENIFAQVFDDGEFHRTNNIARELYALENLFLRGATKRQMLKGLEPYYNSIEMAASQITDHGEKQTFLKVIYEGFYRSYNPKAADRLGVVYTPNEIVRFMVRGADWLCERHFGKRLADTGVEILDPATGTGTFVCELIEHMRGEPRAVLERKYREELHANEVAILPYYVANLNIEATYAGITGQIAEYPNLCFVDTLDNVEGLGIRRGQQMSFLGEFTDENTERVKSQNRRKISVVIGNPPYNANQQNENDNNKNRQYPRIDERIRATFVKLSTAQKTKVYDMYSRFYRWAFDRIADEGVVAFVTNRSFVDARTFDGFRNYVGQEFGDIWIVDLGADVRANPKLSGTMHNVFGIQTGVCIAFFVKGGAGEGIRYVRRPEDERADDKLAWLAEAQLETIGAKRIKPSLRSNWLDQVENEWDDLLPVADKKTKAAKIKGQERAVFKLFSLGVSTNRDAWVYDVSKDALASKMSFFVSKYRQSRGEIDPAIKKSRNLTRRFEANLHEPFDPSRIASSLYRPYSPRFFYRSDLYIDESGSLDAIEIGDQRTEVICFTSGGRLDFAAFATVGLPNLTVLSLDANQCLPRYRYTPTGERIDNITDWAVNKFAAHYRSPKRNGITKDAIFAYVYACLHDPVWRETYAINLRHEFPRIPFHTDFAWWAKRGRCLLDLHVGYEEADPWPIDRHDRDADPGKPKLRSHPAKGCIEIDSATTLTGLPPQAWDYRLGNRAGLDWVLDQHKEKTVRDKTVEGWLKDNPDARYRFADHKERVIYLLARVATVSVKTMKIVDDLREASSVKA
ncbi:type ISP restriction/modification enzyme [Paracoccus spongiarum]|uniref:site-specific DNA-methyltransferase (adenine-specific) n=1 Tax=Paracoccus spongiarum TaxID=3064387 RepID=A0ABT9JFC4_9RHOB|nr:type ISP restriction/modification enzyme [Paracoccus sp. 2205BS29-5]MDP5308420.1 type ISP restriction/modification enzyme [Paracoccus sp. 2205BS29-5]